MTRVAEHAARHSGALYQGTLFPSAQEQFIAEVFVSADEMGSWHRKGWLSFDPLTVADYDEKERVELLFIRGLARSGLSDAMINRMLSSLKKPYCYDPSTTSFSFVENCWISLPPERDQADVTNKYLDGRIENQDWMRCACCRARFPKLLKMPRTIVIDDKRLIEDYLPIVAISAEASREKSVRKGHISTLHLWWARRPLVACRAAVYGALVPASRFVPNGGSDEQKKSLGRANSAKFVKALCMYPGEPRTIQEAQRHILIAHADRLTQELADWKAGNMSMPGWVDEFKFSGARVTMDDIAAGRAPRPRVLDMFAGGGAIPLEALRLGCEAYALDLNPVAHIIQLCTLVYPQKYGKPDTSARGMTGPKNEKGETTWGGWPMRCATGVIGLRRGLGPRSATFIR